jgi:FkbM family methyltransferase
MSKYVYVDVGTGNVGSVVYFLQNHSDHEWEMHLFEPEHSCILKMEQRLKQHNIKNTTIYPVAASDHEGTVILYRAGGADKSSTTIFLGKKRYNDYSNTRQAKCINFDEWVTTHIKADDYNCLNMDTEGSEYVVLPAMIKSGSINLFKELRIEFHSTKFIGENGQLFAKVHNEMKPFFESFPGKTVYYRL